MSQEEKFQESTKFLYFLSQDQKADLLARIVSAFASSPNADPHSILRLFWDLACVLEEGKFPLK